MTDLVAWNSDATRMPYRMHSEYLRHLFFDNDLAEGRVLVDGQAIALADIRVPIFCVGTVRDHIAPWRSTYKINLLTNSEVTYVLATGGHNVGIVSPPSPSARGFQVLTMRVDEPYVDPETYKQRALHKEGSWWIEWIGWLNGRSGPQVAPPPIGLPGADADRLQDAPGSYVLQD
jgi:polyhydroxyalkanoate synthase